MGEEHVASVASAVGTKDGAAGVMKEENQDS